MADLQVSMSRVDTETIGKFLQSEGFYKAAQAVTTKTDYNTFRKGVVEFKLDTGESHY